MKVSMDGKGRALDNVYIERFWKSIKYDYIYLNPSEDGYDLLKGVKWYVEYYNQKVHHTTREKPGERYYGPTRKAS
ncbi:integrase core domain-containing protein [Belliella baltica]|uniref:integrase core domain-containing protein n=1 Tax=Belliella baltica TaxID=232259 RepID=UPI003CCAE4DB